MDRSLTGRSPKLIRQETVEPFDTAIEVVGGQINLLRLRNSTAKPVRRYTYCFHLWTGFRLPAPPL